MKKKLIIISVLIVVALGLFVGVRKVRGTKTEKKQDRIEIVRNGPFIVKLSERGNLEPLVKVEVKSNVEGEIDKLFVDEGHDVQKGQQLLKIDEKQIREAYNQAKANYEAARAEMDRAEERSKLNYDKLTSDIQLSENSLKSSQANLEGTKARAQQQLSRARMSIRSLEDSLEQDTISLNKAQIVLDRAKSSEKSAKVKLDNAKAELDRKKELYNKKYVSLQEVENTQLAYSSADSQYKAAQSDIEAQEKNILSHNKSIESRGIRIQAEKDDLEVLIRSLEKERNQVEIQGEQAEQRLELLKKGKSSEQQISELAKATANASLIRAQSMLNNAKERLDWTTVIAPMSGRIVQCQVEEGEIITSGRSAWSQGPPIMTIADLSKMVVKTHVHEFDIGKVKVGQKAEIKISAYPDDVFMGEVKERSPSGQFMDNVIKFEVIVEVTKAPKLLLPGMTADVDIIVDERDKVLQLPIEAVVQRETIKVKTDIQNDMLDGLKGKTVKLIINDDADKKFDGNVAEIAPPRSGFSTSEVTIIMKGTPKELRPETSRTASLELSKDQSIPNIEARIESEKEYFVKIHKDEVISSPETSDKNKKKKNEEERMIKTGGRNQNSIEILGGLKAGDKVRVIPIGEEMRKKK